MNTKKLVAALVKYNVPSFAPGVGMVLLGVERDVILAADAEEMSETKRLLVQYAAALRTVCDIGVMHQGAVIAQLGALLGGDS